MRRVAARSSTTCCAASSASTASSSPTTSRPALLISHHRVAADKGEAAQRGARGRARRGAARSSTATARRCASAIERGRGRRSRSSTARCGACCALKVALGLFERAVRRRGRGAARLRDAASTRALARARRREVDRAAARTTATCCRSRPALRAHRRHRPGRRRRAPAAGRLLATRRTSRSCYARDGGRAGILPRADGGRVRAGPVLPADGVTPLAGIRAAVADGTEVRPRAGCDVRGDDRRGFARGGRRAARGADVAIVCVGGRSGLLADCTSGEFRDATDLGLTGVQQQLVEAVVATGTPTVVVLVERPRPRAALDRRARAGARRGLAARRGGRRTPSPTCCSARVNPAGRLPISLPRAVGQVPIHHDHKSGGGRSQMLGDYIDLPATPLFPFGHGLSLHALRLRDRSTIAPARAAAARARARSPSSRRTRASAPATRSCSSTCATWSRASRGR